MMRWVFPTCEGVGVGAPLFSGHLPGTLQSSKTSSQVLEPLMPSLSSFSEVLNPGIPFTGNQRRPWLDLLHGGLIKREFTFSANVATCPACQRLTPKCSPSLQNKPILFSTPQLPACISPVLRGAVFSMKHLVPNSPHSPRDIPLKILSEPMPLCLSSSDPASLKEP